MREIALMRNESRNLAAYLLGVLAAPPEKAGRLNAKVADLLGVAVDRAEAVLLLDLLVALLKPAVLMRHSSLGIKTASEVIFDHKSVGLQVSPLTVTIWIGKH